MKQKVKKKRKVFRTLIRLVQRSDKPTGSDSHPLQQRERTKDELGSPYSFSAGEYKHMR